MIPCVPVSLCRQPHPTIINMGVLGSIRIYYSPILISLLLSSLFSFIQLGHWNALKVPHPPFRHIRRRGQIYQVIAHSDRPNGSDMSALALSMGTINFYSHLPPWLTLEEHTTQLEQYNPKGVEIFVTPNGVLHPSPVNLQPSGPPFN